VQRLPAGSLPAFHGGSSIAVFIDAGRGQAARCVAACTHCELKDVDDVARVSIGQEVLGDPARVRVEVMGNAELVPEGRISSDPA
jgi:hypothetical protein